MPSLKEVAEPMPWRIFKKVYDAVFGTWGRPCESSEHDRTPATGGLFCAGSDCSARCAGFQFI